MTSGVGRLAGVEGEAAVEDGPGEVADCEFARDPDDDDGDDGGNKKLVAPSWVRRKSQVRPPPLPNDSTRLKKHLEVAASTGEPPKTQNLHSQRSPEMLRGTKWAPEPVAEPHAPYLQLPSPLRVGASTCSDGFETRFLLESL